MSTRRRTDILAFIWPLAVMAALYFVSSIPGEAAAEPAIIDVVFSWFSPTVHNVLHIPAYALLAWTFFRCIPPSLQPRIALPLIVLIAGVYGALLELHQIYVPGRYASITDVLFNFIGATAGTWLAWKSSLPAARTSATP